MEHHYIKGKEVAFFDEEITALIDENDDEFGSSGHSMDVGVKNEKGDLYRVVRCWGLGEYMRFTQAMLSLGFDDVLYDNTGTQNGLDSLFVPTLEVLNKKGQKLNEITVLQEIEQAEDDLRVLNDTEKDSIIKSRLGQGLFRQQLITYWGECAVTGATFIQMLKASHIKPWRTSTNEERLSLYNGLLLSPNLDSAFDAGYISFDDNGKIIISSKMVAAWRYELHISQKMRIQKKLNPQHLIFLAHHREHIYIGD